MQLLPEVTNEFSRVEVKKRQYLGTKLSGAEKLGPHTILLTKGTVPEYIKQSSFQDLAWRTMGRAAKARVSNNQLLEESLLKAHMKIRPEEYLAYVLMATLVAAIIGIAIGIGIGITLFSLLGVAWILRIMVAVVAIMLPPMMTYFLLIGVPGSKAKTRAKDIDKRIAAAMSFISAMASADPGARPENMSGRSSPRAVGIRTLPRC